MTLLVNKWENFILVLCSSIYLVDSNMVIDKTNNMIKGMFLTFSKASKIQSETIGTKYG